jgi:hypothetical protein
MDRSGVNKICSVVDSLTRSKSIVTVYYEAADIVEPK